MISVCIDMMFPHLDFYNRINAVRECGINTVEFQKWSNKDTEKIKDSGIGVSVFELDSSDKRLSKDLSRGILNQGRTEEFLSAIRESIPVYHRLGASGMTVFIGENAPYNEENVYRCITDALPLLKENDVNILIEPLNDIDTNGYSMPYAAPIFELLRKINDPHVKMLYDIYHRYMMGDFSVEAIKSNIEYIGHFHVADAPGRHEPGTGSIDYVNVLNEISAMNYSGYVGLKYRSTQPDHKTLDFLSHTNPLTV